MIRRLLLLLLAALAVVLVVADRLAVQAAEHAVAVKVHEAALLRDDPSVTIRGFPFLTQAIAGRYREVDITAHGIHRGGVRIDTVSAQFFGVHVSLRDALAGRVGGVRIDRSSGSVLLTFTDLNGYLATRRVQLAPDPAHPGEVAVRAQLSVAGRSLAVSGELTAALSGRTVTLVPVAGTLRVAGVRLPAALLAPVTGALGVSVDTGVLPFGLRVNRVSVTSTGVLIGATATGLLVPVPANAGSS